jgi:hypothetical protein
LGHQLENLGENVFHTRNCVVKASTACIHCFRTGFSVGNLTVPLELLHPNTIVSQQCVKGGGEAKGDNPCIVSKNPNLVHRFQNETLNFFR